MIFEFLHILCRLNVNWLKLTSIAISKVMLCLSALAWRMTWNMNTWYFELCSTLPLSGQTSWYLTVMKLTHCGILKFNFQRTLEQRYNSWPHVFIIVVCGAFFGGASARIISSNTMFIIWWRFFSQRWMLLIRLLQ